MTSVTAVVVHYRGRDVLARCVRALLDGGAVQEVVVVDNEGDGAAEAIRADHPSLSVRIVASATNLGYGRAANLGLDLATGDAVLVTNQDTVVDGEAVRELVRVAGASGAWVVGPRLVGSDGGVAPLKDRFPAPLRWDPPARRAGDGWRAAPWVPGAVMLFAPGHTELRFDERLFMYAEDEELCYRVWQQGGRVCVAERALVRHAGGTATTERWSQASITARTVANRARVVRWHRGWRGVGTYLGADLAGRVARRFSAGEHPR